MPVVLLVAPDPAVHAAVVPLLVAEFYTVVSVRDSEAAIALLRSLPVDAVIGDATDPGHDLLGDYLRRHGPGELRPLSGPPSPPPLA